MTMRFALLLAVCLAAVAPAAELASPKPSVDLKHGPVKVSADKRFLVHADGTPFFYLGDTAWELFHRLDRDEAKAYLADRAGKGFTVIQAVVLAELDGLNEPNSYGERPLIDNDPTRPNEKYFAHVDFIVDTAESLGMFVGMLPTWGDKWNKKWGKGPEIFTPENAETYGEFIGKRYKNKPIIWILGGDRNPENDQHLAITRAMAKGIARGDGGSHLMTFHPQGGACSAKWFHRDDWLSFNMFQSGHGERDIANYQTTKKTRALEPTKPVLDGEPRYEDHPVNWNAKNGWFDEYDVRQAAYWSLLAGACGHTYGDHNIWQMWQPPREPISAARTPWREAMAHPGAAQLGHARRLFESMRWQELVPGAEHFSLAAEHLAGAQSSDGRFAVVYLPLGKPLTVDLRKLSGSKVTASWFDPRTGKSTEIANYANDGPRQFTPPGQPGRGNDWVLVLTATK